MERISNLFFYYVVLCIGFGIGNVYWNKDYTNYIFIGVSLLIGLLIIFSKELYTMKSHNFFRSQLFSILLLSLLCMFIQSDKSVYKIIDAAVSKMLLGAFVFWAFSIGRHSGENNRRKNEEKNDGKGNNMPGTGRYPKPA